MIRATVITMISLAVAVGAVIHVPSDYSTIQEAVTAAEQGDEIIIQPGMYPELVTTEGKQITLRSIYPDTDNPEDISNTIISGDLNGDGIGDGTVLTVAPEGWEQFAVIVGLTITNGDALQGGGVNMFYAAPVFESCRIISNIAVSGGAAFCDSSTPTFTNCEISGNSAMEGGGTCILPCPPRKMEPPFTA